MAEEKETTSEKIDDWLDDIEESEEFSGELDQDNIDALLGAGADEAGPSADAPEPPKGDELDQDNIDAFFEEGGLPADEEEPEASAGMDELDQAGIDALLGSDDALGQDAAEEAVPELDQANIDALLGGGAESSREAVSEEAREADSDKDQSSIDDLLESSQKAALADEPVDDLDQASIDALLGDDDKTEETDFETSEDEEDSDLDIFLGGGAGEQTSTGDGLEIEQDEIDRLFAGLDDDEDEDLFQAEEMDFAEVIESDADEELEWGTVGGRDKTLASDKTEAAAQAPGASVAEEQGEEERIVAQSGFPFIPESLNRTSVAAIGGTLILLLVFCLYFFRSDGDDETLPVKPPEVAEVKKEEPPASEKREAAANFIPVASDTVVTMPPAGGAIPLQLSAKDKDDSALTFSVISPPRHGRLSGDAPSLTYLPDATFPGEDRFEYMVSDGKDTSNIATVVVRGPDLAGSGPAEIKQKGPVAQKVLVPQKGLVAARDVTIETSSTSPVEINWGTIWQEANKTRFTRDTYLDLDASSLRGDLKKLAPGKYRYTPDPFFDGTEVIGYRFKKGGVSSPDHQVVLEVALGSPAPEIHLKKLGAGYLVGQTVVLDATPSRDEARESLEFTWEQMAGVPVQLAAMNEEESVVSFVMPSSFYTEEKPGPTFRLTARDETGKTDSLLVKVPVISRRQTALWRAENGVIADDPPMSGSYLPWPYSD